MSYSERRFYELYSEFAQHEQELLNIKRGEYTQDGDADSLQNFRQVAAFEGRRPEEVCLTYIIPAIDSIITYHTPCRLIWLPTGAYSS